MIDIASIQLKELIAQAWSLRNEFDLSNVGYGRTHWGDQTQILTTPASYYYFLAGITRVTKARRVLEVGTHQGGSTRAIARGLSEQSGSRVVTFDVTRDGAEMFMQDPVVHAFTMDGGTEAAMDAALTVFGSPSVDLAFIDSTHEFWSTLNIIALWTTAFSCPLVVLDDITLNPSMRRLWNVLLDRFGETNAVNAVEVDAAIRTGGDGTTPGFGVLRIPQ